MSSVIFAMKGGMEPNECPKGYRCQELKDENDVVVNRLCFRDCTFN